MVQVMPSKGPELEYEDSAEVPEIEMEPARDHLEPVSAPARNNSSPSSGQNIPRWRKIEIMKERAALREALGDDELDLDALEEEVFGTEEENESLYRHDLPGDDEVEPLEEIPFDDDEFDDFNED